MAQLATTFIGFGEMSSGITFTAATGNDYFVPESSDGRVGIVIKNVNTQSATVTLKAGDGDLSPLGDVAVSVEGGQTACLPLVRAETARVKLTSGPDKGKVFVSTAVGAGGAVGSVGIGVVCVE